MNPFTVTALPGIGPRQQRRVERLITTKRHHGDSHTPVLLKTGFRLLLDNSVSKGD